MINSWLDYRNKKALSLNKLKALFWSLVSCYSVILAKQVTYASDIDRGPVQPLNKPFDER